MPAQWVDIPLATQAGKDIAGNAYASDADLVNLMLRANPPGSRTPFHIASTPTLSTSGITTPGSGLPRGLCVQQSTQNVFFVRGTGVYYGNAELSSWTTVPVGTMPGAEFCRMVDAETHVVSVDQANARAITTAESFACSRGDFLDVAYQDGFTIYAEMSSRSLYASGVDDPTTINALSFNTADALPGHLGGIISDHREIFAFKSASTERHYNAGGSGFPFRRSSPGLVERGVWGVASGTKTGVHTIAKYDNTVFWLGDDRRVYAMQGGQPRVISTPSVDRYIHAYGYSASSPTGGRLFGAAYALGGVTYYMLSGLYESGASTTLVCDVSNRLWHKRRSPLSEGAVLTHGVMHPNLVNVERVLIAGTSDGITGSLYWLDIEGANDSGASSQTTRTMTLPQLAPAGGERVTMHELFLDMQAPSTTGTMTVQWSDDGGTTWSSAVSGVVTEGGVRWSRLGMFRQRTLRFNFEIASKLAIMGVRARIEVGA